MDNTFIGKIEILDTQTGETRISDSLEGFPFNLWGWTDGNWSCDCNREGFFKHAGKDEFDPYEDRVCNHNTPRYQVRVLSTDGTSLYCDIQSS